MKFYGQFAGLVASLDASYTMTGLFVIKWNMPYDVYDSKTKSTTTQWLRCVAFGERFEKLANEGYLADGRTVQVNGTIKSVAFTKRDNTAGSSIEMTVNDVSFVQISKGNVNANPVAKTPGTVVTEYVDEGGNF